MKQHKKALTKAAETLGIAQAALKKSSRVWRGLGNMDFSVSQEGKAQEKQGLKPEQVREALQHYLLGQSCSAPGLSLQEFTMPHATRSIRGGHQVRQHFFTVKGHEFRSLRTDIGIARQRL